MWALEWTRGAERGLTICETLTEATDAADYYEAQGCVFVAWAL